MKEGAFRTKVLAYLRKRGGHWDSNPVSVYGHSGRSDIIGCYKGHFVAIELKSPEAATVKLDPDQKIYIDSILANSGVAIWTNDLSLIEFTLDNVDKMDAEIRAKLYG